MLPMLPMYISYFAGGDNEGDSKRNVLINALGFVAGFTVVFVALGAFAGYIGSFLVANRRMVDIVGGAIIIIFGLNYLGVLKIAMLNRHYGTEMRANSGVFGSFTLGVVFSIGWTPCVGVFLGSALILASQEGQTLTGVLMLLIYSLGLGIPFVLCAVLIDAFKSTFDFIKRNYKIINFISGSLLIALGVLMVTGVLGRIMTELSYFV